MLHDLRRKQAKSSRPPLENPTHLFHLPAIIQVLHLNHLVVGMLGIDMIGALREVKSGIKRTAWCDGERTFKISLGLGLDYVRSNSKRKKGQRGKKTGTRRRGRADCQAPTPWVSAS